MLTFPKLLRLRLGIHSSKLNHAEPNIPTPEDVTPRMLELASVESGEVVFDLGSGDGRSLS